MVFSGTRAARRGRSKTVSDFMLERLSEWGVDRIYGYPGDGMNGILGALAAAEDRFEFIQVPHEEVAAFSRSERRRS
jgi:pyruvate dehydrogenase (quinone)